MIESSLRTETAADQKEIQALVVAAFKQKNEADLVDRLRSAGALTLSIVAERDGVIVGHVAVSPVTIVGREDAKWFGLGPIAVSPDCQRQGIGAALMHKALKETAAIGGQGMVLLGNPAYYARFGFQPSTDFGLPWEKGGGPYFQAVKLGATVTPSGTVKYHAAFDDV